MEWFEFSVNEDEVMVHFSPPVISSLSDFFILAEVLMFQMSGFIVN